VDWRDSAVAADDHGLSDTISAAMRMKSIALSLLVVAMLGGCASTSRVMLAPARPALAPDQVRVYFAPPPGRYQEIALLQTASGPLTYGEQNKMDNVIAKLRTAAAKLGANGVLFQGAANGYGGSNVGVGVGGGSFGGHTRIGGGVGVNISPTPKYASGTAIFVEGVPSGMAPSGGTLSDTPVPKPQD
jgi:hypothetical protein